MKQCLITESSDQPTTATILANQHLLKRYFDSTGECNQFEYAAVKLYNADEQTQDSLNFAFGDSTNLTNLSSANRKYTSYPITYQRKQIGHLQLTGGKLGDNTTTPESAPLQSQIAQDAETVAKRIALLIKRGQANTLSGLYLGKPLSLNGYSEPIFSLEEFIEKAAGVKAPVVIEGAFGCEKLAVASSIHYNSPLKHKPFIEINCGHSTAQEFRQKIINCFVQAKGGSIYLHSVDLLTLAHQDVLIDLLGACTGTSGDEPTAVNTADVRLLLSTTLSLPTLVEKGQFSKQLYSLLNFLHVQIPALSERKEDINIILEQLVNQHQLYPDQKLSEEVKQALCQYDWPENYQELECTIARILALANSNPVNMEELQLHAPQVVANQPSKSKQIAANEQTAEAQTFDLIKCLLSKDYSAFSHLHAGLQKALQYVAENYCSEITLTELAQNAYVSPSHLSYLLKFYLKRSFKQILAELRIEKAKITFAKTPNVRITDVSLDVGFGDLSHFEKIFKRYTNVTPRQYKNNQKLNS